MTAPTDQRKSLRDLRNSDETLYAKNNGPTKITCNTPDGKVHFELDPAGSVDSIKVLPKECLSEPGLQKLWRKGTVDISTDESMEEKINILQNGSIAYVPKVYSVDKQGNPIEVDAEVVAPAHTRDIIYREQGNPAEQGGRNYGIVPSGGPDSNKCVFCKAPVMLAQQFVEQGEPPLCQAHVDDKGRVVSTPQPDGTWLHQPISMQPIKRVEDPD